MWAQTVACSCAAPLRVLCFLWCASSTFSRQRKVSNPSPPSLTKHQSQESSHSSPSLPITPSLGSLHSSPPLNLQHAPFLTFPGAFLKSFTTTRSTGLFYWVPPEVCVCNSAFTFASDWCLQNKPCPSLPNTDWCSNLLHTHTNQAIILYISLRKWHILKTVITKNIKHYNMINIIILETLTFIPHQYYLTTKIDQEQILRLFTTLVVESQGEHARWGSGLEGKGKVVFNERSIWLGKFC